MASNVGRSAFAPVAGARGRLAEWVAAPRDAIMCYTHLPPSPALAAVIVCPPLFLEASENHRAEMLLADALVARGIAVQRFDYRGYGNSTGDPQVLTLASAEEDCVLAGRRLLEHAGTAIVGVIGTRWGALVAAGAAAALGASAVAFWEAKPDGRGYFDELARVSTFNDMWHGRRRPAADALDILGWRVHPEVVASSVGSSVAGCLRPGVRLRAVYGRGRQADVDRLTADLEAVAGALSLSVLAERVLWWVGTNRLVRPDDPASPLELEAEATAEWLADQLTS